MRVYIRHFGTKLLCSFVFVYCSISSVLSCTDTDQGQSPFPPGEDVQTAMTRGYTLLTNDKQGLTEVYAVEESRCHHFVEVLNPERQQSQKILRKPRTSQTDRGKRPAESVS